MKIIKNQRIVEDTWTYVEAEAPLPEGDVIVSLERWQRQRELLIARPGRVAVWLDGEDDVRDIAEDLEHLDLIALHFPRFTDGRCYSHARILRTQLGYRGDLRAFGDVLRDQLHHMHRCGINEFQVSEDKDIRDALQAFDTYSVSYEDWGQPPLGGLPAAPELADDESEPQRAAS